MEDGVEERAPGTQRRAAPFNEDSRFVAALQFDDETITAGRRESAPRSRQKTCTAPTPLDGGAESLIRQLVATMRSCLRGIAAEILVGIGIADPGLVDSRRGVVLSCSTIPFWREVPLREIFEREFGVPVTVETHTRAKTVAERGRKRPTPARP